VSGEQARGVPRPTYEKIFWLGVVVYIAGRIVDLIWHATHPGFETALDQVQAHAVVWVGGALLLGSAGWAVVRGAHRAYRVVLGGSILYAAVAVWHFLEHARGRDPDLPHVLLLVSFVVILAGVSWVAWRSRRGAVRPDG
jgi:hypothetical protein